jgi:hypothetical protein
MTHRVFLWHGGKSRRENQKALYYGVEKKNPAEHVLKNLEKIKLQNKKKL